MGNLYQGLLGPIEKLINNNGLSENHPYYDLWCYILLSKKEEITRHLIRKQFSERFKFIHSYLNEETGLNLQLDFSEVPHLGKIYMDNNVDNLSKIESIRKIDDEKLENFVDEVYEDVYQGINVPLLSGQTDKLKQSILRLCFCSLKSLKYKNKNIIVDGLDSKTDEKKISVDKSLLYEFFCLFDNDTLRNLNSIVDSNKRKKKVLKRQFQLEAILKNYRECLNFKIVEILEKQIADIEHEILSVQMFDDKNYNKMIKYLRRENVIRTEQGVDKIVITSSRLAELKISEDLFSRLNQICRLNSLKESFGNINSDVHMDVDVKDFISNQLKVISFDGLESNDVSNNPMFIKLYDAFATYLQDEIADCICKVMIIENEQQLLKPKKIADMESNPGFNIKCLFYPNSEGVYSGLDAIYILNVLMLLEDEKYNDDVLSFVENKNNCRVDAGLEAKIRTSVDRVINDYFENDFVKKKGEL